MLEVFVKLINSMILSLTGFYVIKRFIKSEQKLNSKTLLILLALSLLTVVLYKIEYTGMYTITIFVINIMIYKKIFKINFEDSIISTGILMVTLFLSDLSTSIIFRMFFSLNTIRSSIILIFITNLIVCLTNCLLINISFIRKQIQIFYLNCRKRTSVISNVFFVLLIIGFSLIAYNITTTSKGNPEYIANSIVMIIFAIITYIFIKSKNNYNQLTDEYDSLFSYIQTFEDWIEKEQLNRHEYKNQLAVLRCLTKEKKVKDKIDEILEDNINIEGDIVHQLKVLPKGGIKGLMYYKVALAQKNKINVEVNVSLENKSELTKLKEKDIRVLCKLIGIYLDNAIEAAVEPRKRELLIEVYEIKDKITFVFSNTFKRHKNFKDRNKKGISTKGEGRGNGLYFASNLIAKNEWLFQKQEIIDGYYIQQLVISKKNKSHH